MIRLPVYLVVAQWALLLALGALVVVVFRQLGRLTAGAGKSPELGPAAGSRAAALTYTKPGSRQTGQVRPGEDGLPLLLAFVDPTCPSCEDLVTVLDAMYDAGELDGLRALLLISDPPSYLRISDVFSRTTLEIGRPASRDGLDSYQVSATPLLVAVDAEGMVRASGSVVRPEQVRAFIQAALLPAPERALAAWPAGQGSVAENDVAPRGDDAR